LIFYIFEARMNYNVDEEVGKGKGHIDLIFLSKKIKMKPLIIIQLKLNSTAENALEQIKEKQYILN